MPETHAARFAAALARLRGAAGLTHYRLAGLAGISQTELARMERGRREPKLATLCRLCDALGCSMDELTGRDRAEGA